MAAGAVMPRARRQRTRRTEHHVARAGAHHALDMFGPLPEQPDDDGYVMPLPEWLTSGRAGWTPEQRLVAAVIGTAIEDVAGYCPPVLDGRGKGRGGKATRVWRVRARRWLRGWPTPPLNIDPRSTAQGERPREEGLSFDMCCTMLRLSTSAASRAILRQAKNNK